MILLVSFLYGFHEQCQLFCHIFFRIKSNAEFHLTWIVLDYYFFKKINMKQKICCYRGSKTSDSNFKSLLLRALLLDRRAWRIIRLVMSCRSMWKIWNCDASAKRIICGSWSRYRSVPSFSSDVVSLESRCTSRPLSLLFWASLFWILFCWVCIPKEYAEIKQKSICRLHKAKAEKKWNLKLQLATDFFCPIT